MSLANFRDNDQNILGANNSNNAYDSTNVVSNADGSMIERQEYMQTLLAAVTTAQVVLKGAADGGTSSTTVIPIASLAGYGDDFFNNQWYMQVLHNDNSAGASPEKETRLITDYASATGAFTCSAFGSAVEAGDLCLILHESQVLLGRDDNNNAYATTNVVANEDGSVLERLEFIQEQVSGTDSVSNVIGANNANNQYDSSTVGANVDGSILERLEDIKDRINAVDDYVDNEVSAIQTDIGNPSIRTNFQTLEAMIGIPDAANSCVDDILRTGFDSSAITANEDGSALERLEQIQESVNKGSGTALAANKSLVDALGTDGSTVTDSAVSVLGAVGADNANNAFASTNVVANADGSVLERQEYTQQVVDAIQTDLGNPSARTNLQTIEAMLGNPDVASNSLWNALFVNGGLATFPAAAAPSNGNAIAQVLRDIWDVVRNGTGGSEPGTNRSIVDEIKGAALNYNSVNYVAVPITFAVGTTGSVASHEILTVTGLVRLRMLIECTDGIADGGSGGTIKLGVEGATGGFIAATGGTDIDTGDIWIDATPTENYGNFSSLVFDKVINGLDVGYEVETGTLSGGTLVFHCWWEPLNSSGAVVAADGTSGL